MKINKFAILYKVFKLEPITISVPFTDYNRKYRLFSLTLYIVVAQSMEYSQF